MLFTGLPKRDPTPLRHSPRHLPILSPMHQRADHSRKILKINEAIRSLLSISHMERMDLIAINNRSLCNHSKVQRAGRTTRKLNRTEHLPLSDPTPLRLDYRRGRSLKKEQEREGREGRGGG